MQQADARHDGPQQTGATGTIRHMRGIRAGLAAMLMLLLGAVPAGPAAGAPGCGGAPGARPSGPPVTGTPWPQLRYQPQRLAGIADGTGIVVAVLDSGVDATVPPLRDRVLVGADELDAGDGRRDCVGHGTAVASIIAAAPSQGSLFVGLAPRAQILPVRVTEDLGTDPGARSGSVAGLVAALRWAVARGARVVNLSLVVYQDVPALRDEVADARRHDVVVVAAVGNAHTGSDDPDQTPYPAAYPGVIGVGSIGPDGQRSTNSPVGPFVDLVAPGGAVPALTRDGQLTGFDGSSFAAPFVSATAALIRQERPGLTADQVAARIVGTADRAPAGPDSTGYGAGILNPYRAVTEELASPARSTPPVPVPAPAEAPPPTDGTGHRAVLLAGFGAGLAALLLLLAVVVPRGARRGWQPGRG
jgi:membrane-anchored mycosin MYCP